MLESLHDLLAHSPLLRLFAVIGIGYLVGRWKIAGVSLGVAAVLFVGLMFGAWDSQAFELPAILSTVGLTVFVYTLGLASGPAVFGALSNREGLKMSLVTAISILVGALCTVACSKGLNLPASQSAGLFAGALTNTPALAAQLEYQERLLASGVEVSKSGPAVGYALGYPFGVLGVFLVMYLLRNSPRLDLEQERAAFYRESGTSNGPVQSRNYVVTRLKPNGNQLEAEWIRQETGLVVARRLHSSQLDLATGDTVLAVGDIVLAVGTPEMHQLAGTFLGEIAKEHLEDHCEVIYRRFFVSNSNLIGKPIGQLDLHLNSTVTRIRRGDVEFPASPNFLLSSGDVVRVVTHPDNVPRLIEYFGDSLEDIAHTDFLSIALGLVMGILMGMIPLPFGAAPYPTLGVAGGTLFVALGLGRLGRTGGIIWTLSREANLALRQFGLLLFLATVGLKAGGQFKGAFDTNGLRLIFAGVLVTLSTSLTLSFMLRRWMRHNLMTTLGVVAGAQTQPACLAYGENLISDQGPELRDGLNVGYAAVFPVAMVMKIVLATALLSLLGPL
jgi:putative transport protein